MRTIAKEDFDAKLSGKASTSTTSAALRRSKRHALKIENFPIEIQERIFGELPAVDRVRVELVSRQWRSLVRKNGWGLNLELSCLCLQNFDRLQKIGFAPLVRQLVLHTDCQVHNHDSKAVEKALNVSAFANLVHLRIEHFDRLLVNSLFKQIDRLEGLKTLSLTHYKCSESIQLVLSISLSPLEVLVVEEAKEFASFPSLSHQLKSLWLDGKRAEEVEFYDLFPGLHHLGLGRIPLSHSFVKHICQLKNSLRHLSFKIPEYYQCNLPASRFCGRFRPLRFDGLAQMFSSLSAALTSLEVENIGPNELTLIFSHCKRLEHFSFIFASREGVSDWNVVSMLHAMRGLATALPHLRSLDFLFTSRRQKNQEPMKSVVAELLAPTMRSLADQGRIEYFNPVIFGWNEEREKEEPIPLPDHVAFQFLLCCSNLRFLGHQFQDSDSKGRLTKILDDKLASGERSLAGNLLLMPKQHFPFSHLLVAFSEHKPRNHVFCAIREAGLTAVPPDFFFPKMLITDPLDYFISAEDSDEEDESNSEEDEEVTDEEMEFASSDENSEEDGAPNIF